MLSVVIPVKDMHDATLECVNNLEENAEGELDIIIVDNASERPVSDIRQFRHLNIQRQDTNIGFWPAMMLGAYHAMSNYVLFMHNDVFIYEKNFDKRIIEEFRFDEKLAAVGLFGGRGVDVDGGRGHPEGNMQGAIHGTAQNLHGFLLTEEHPAVVFDSLAICVDKHKLVAADPFTIPPHHWTDRLLCLRLVRAGFHCLTVGVAFDHGGSFTASTSSMNTFSEDWCKFKGLELEETWEKTLYNYGLRMFQKEFLEMTGGKKQLWVDKDYRYYVR